jgi:hypothetical protein
MKSKKSLVFAELISELLVESSDIMPEESPINGDIFLIASLDPSYGDILVYLKTLKFPTSASHDEHQRIWHHARNFIIIDGTLYC